jgi:D-alanine-D-alanine ligase
MHIREIELAVLGTDDAKVSTPGEVIAGADFYSYDDKYATDSKSTVQIPARLDASIVHQLQAYALEAYQLTRGQGMARVDFFVTDEGQIYLNEINAIPGFTNISMYPKLWQHDGMTYSELLDRLIIDSLAQRATCGAV